MSTRKASVAKPFSRGAVVVAVLAFGACGSGTFLGPDGGTGGGGSDAVGGGAGGGGAGGGGGTDAGLDAGTDAGVDAGLDAGDGRECRLISFTGDEALQAHAAPPVTDGGPALDDAFYQRPAASGAIGKSDFLDLQFWFVDPLMLPATITLSGKSWLTCDQCVLYSEDCNAAGGNCAHDYLAVRGTFVVTRASSASDGGQYAGLASGLLLEEWDTAADVSRDAGCVRISAIGWDAGW